MSSVSLVEAGKEANLGEAIEKSLDLIDFRFPQNLSKVVIKPDMCHYLDYSTGETTDPRLVSELIDVLRRSNSRDPDISIVESDTSVRKFRRISRFLGYGSVSKEKGVALINLTEDGNQKIVVEVANDSYEFLIPNTIEAADLFINVPKIKYHPATTVSCALMNIYGCNPVPNKSQYHSSLADVVVGLNKALKPNLCLVDGLIVRGTQTRKLGLIMASIDPVATDSAAARICGMNPKKIRTIVLAERERVGSLAYEAVGESVEFFACRFPKRRVLDRIRFRLIRAGVSTLRRIGLEVPAF